MLAKKVNAVVAELKQITSGCVGNNVIVSNSKGTVTASGFVSLIGPNDDVLQVALDWTKAGKAESTIYEIEELPGGAIKIKRPQVIGAMVSSSSDADALVEDFLDKMSPKVTSKVKLVLSGKKGGGVYTGPRLEAWPSHKAAPRDNFGKVIGVKFTPEFVKRARASNVTYK